MREASSHGGRTRERIGPNTYRRQTKTGQVVYEVMFRDVDGVQRSQTFRATSDTAAMRESRKILAGRDAGERQVAAPVTLRDFVQKDFEPHLDALAAAGLRARQGVKLDKDHLRLYLLDDLGDLKLGDITGADIARVLRKLRLREPRPLTEGTLRHACNVLRSVFRLARSRRIVTRSPLDDLTRPNAPGSNRARPDGVSRSRSSPPSSATPPTSTGPPSRSSRSPAAGSARRSP